MKTGEVYRKLDEHFFRLTRSKLRAVEVSSPPLNSFFFDVDENNDVIYGKEKKRLEPEDLACIIACYAEMGANAYVQCGDVERGDEVLGVLFYLVEA